jgi:hypothetical protein
LKNNARNVQKKAKIYKNLKDFANVDVAKAAYCQLLLNDKEFSEIYYLWGYLTSEFRLHLISPKKYGKFVWVQTRVYQLV